MLLLVDLDGVVYRGAVPVPRMAEVLRRRVDAGDRVVYVTNNSSRHRTDYVDRLSGMGLPVDEDGIVSAGRATAVAISEWEPRPRRVMVFGGPGLSRELRDVGLRTVAPTPTGLAAEPDVVVVGVDFSLSYRRLSVAADAIRAGARFVATNRDANYPTAEGLAAGAGAIVAAVEVAAGRPPDLVVGKPEARLFQAAAKLCGEDPAQAVVVGDGLRTDIAAARAVGARSVLMLTGVTTRALLEAASEAERPTAVAEDAAALERILAELDGAAPRRR